MRPAFLPDFIDQPLHMSPAAIFSTWSNSPIGAPSAPAAFQCLKQLLLRLAIKARLARMHTLFTKESVELAGEDELAAARALNDASIKQPLRGSFLRRSISGWPWWMRSMTRKSSVEKLLSCSSPICSRKRRKTGVADLAPQADHDPVFMDA